MERKTIWQSEKLFKQSTALKNYCFIIIFFSIQVGVFPSNFVSVTDNALSAVENVKTNGDTFSTTATPTATPTPTPSTPLEMAPKLPPKPVREMARVLYSYSALQPDELELKEGDLVIILVKDCEDKGWWKGELNGKVEIQILSDCY